MADYDTTLPGWRVRAGTYRVALARHTTDRTLVRTTMLEAQTMRP